MNLLYEDMANQNNLDTYTKQIDNPKISFENYISSFDPNPDTKSNTNPSPNPDPDPDTNCNTNASTTPKQDPTPNTTHISKTDPDPNPKLKKEQTYYNVGISKCNNVEDSAVDDNDIIMDTIADSGADVDVISGSMKDSYTNITKLVNTTLNGIGGPSRVHESADHTHLDGLHTDQGLINNSSNMSCLSISQRAAKGWLFWASGGMAQLVTPTRIAYNFLLKEGLYRLTKRVTNYKGVVFGPREDPSAEEELVTDENHTIMKSVTKEAKAKGENSAMTIPTMALLLLLSILTNTPGLSAIPFIQMLINKSGSNIDSIIDNNIPKTRNKVRKVPMYEHACKRHYPHNPKCDACLRARMMAKSNTSNDEDLIVRGSEKGFVYSMDYVGPYSPVTHRM